MRTIVGATLVFLIVIVHNGNANENVIAKLTQNENSPESPLNDESLVECIVELTQITFAFTPTILILECERQHNDDDFFYKVISTFAKKDVAITIQDRESHKLDQKLDVYDGNVIVIVHFEKIADLLNFTMYDVDKRVKYIMIMFELSEDWVVILQTFGRQYIESDITFILQDFVTETHKVITFLPKMDSKTCKLVDQVKPTVINVCRNGSLETDAVFPTDMYFNFKNCPIKVGMASMFPFSQIPDEDKLKNYDLIQNIEGVDVEVIKIIAKYFNATLVWHYLDRDAQNPFTNIEYMQFIYNGSVNVSAGGLYRIYGENMSYSGIYSKQSVYWIYAAHRNGRSWFNLVHKLHEIYIFDIIFICYSISSYFFRKFDGERFSFRNIVLYSWGLLMGAASLPEPKTLKHKILDTSYLIMCIYMGAYMNIQLVSFLTIDGPAISFKTNDDIYKSGLTPYLNYKNKDFVEDIHYITFANTSEPCGDFSDCTFKALNNSGVTAILDEYFYPLQSATAVKDEARILKTTQKILTVYHEMVITKDSLIASGFRRIVEKLFEAGICQHLFIEAIGITVVAKADSANKNALSNSYSCESGCAIKLSQFAGIFYFWSFGCFVSFCALLLEILWKRKRRFVVVD